MPKTKKNTNRRAQTPKVKSPEARALTLSKRGNIGDRVPSGKVYKKWDGKYDA